MIKGIGLQNRELNLSASGRVVNSPAINRAAQNNLTAEASSNVTFSESTEAIAAIYNITPVRHAAGSQVNAALQSQALDALHAKGVGMNGIGSALLSTLVSQRADSVISIPASDAGNSDTRSAIALDITTQSGVSVSLQMTRQSKGVEIELKTAQGKLSEDEAQAISQLSGALQKTLDGLDDGNGHVDIGDLLAFNTQQLKSIDLKTDLRSGDTVLQSLNLHADDQSRWLAFHNADASFRLTTDMRHLSQTGSAAQQQSALAQWSDKFDKAAQRGQGDRAALGLFKAGFTQLNSTRAATGQKPEAPQAITVGANAAKAGAISGLADFSAIYQQTARASNPMKPEEEDTFGLTLAQQSSQQQNGDQQTLTQDGVFTFNASFHTALSPGQPLALTEQKSSQNYQYHQIHDEERTSTTVTQDDKGNLSAQFSQQLKQHESVKTYQLAKLIDSMDTPHSESHTGSRRYAPAGYLKDVN